MSSQETFVEDFIEECISKGIKSQKDICNAALLKMQEIDRRLRSSNQLRIEFKNLKQVLKELGHESIKKPRINEEIQTNGDIGEIENSAYLAIMINICNFVNNANKNTITSREIVNAVGSMENDQEIYICIKNLYDNGILTRYGDKERYVIKGPSWESRPQNQVLEDKIA
jgi:hypothetical protein